MSIKNASLYTKQYSIFLTTLGKENKDRFKTIIFRKKIIELGFSFCTSLFYQRYGFHINEIETIQKLYHRSLPDLREYLTTYIHSIYTNIEISILK